METVSPNTSPTLRTPLTTSFNMNILPAPTYSLPPINSFPNWNRTKLTNKQPASKIKRDEKIEYICSLHHLDRFTQTTPPSLKTLKSIRSPPVSDKKNNNDFIHDINKNNVISSADVFEKKILFLQESHKEVLSSLHREVESLKNQNKALQFQLVSKEDSSLHPSKNFDPSKNTYNSDENYLNQERVYLLEQEIQSLRSSLLEEKKRNTILLKRPNNLRERSISAQTTKTNNTLVKDKDSSMKLETKSLSARQTMDKNRNNETLHHTKITELKLINSKHQMTRMRDEPVHSSNNRKTILPSVVTTNLRLNPKHTTTKLPTDRDYHQKSHEDFTLPKIQNSSSSQKQNMSERQKQNMSERQKRARFNHMKRQKSNRNVFLGISGIK